MNDKLARWIHNTVAGVFREEDFPAALQALQLFLDLEPGPLRFADTIEDMADCPDHRRPARIQVFSDIENFMKKLCRIINPTLMDTPPRGKQSWSLEPLYKQAFSVVPENLSLTYANSARYRGDANYLDHYIRIYQYRNSLTHEKDKDPVEVPRAALAVMSIQDTIISMLVLELNLCLRYAPALEKRYARLQRRKAFNAEDFCKDICTRYQKAEKAGFGYVDFHWFCPSSQDKNLEIRQILGKNYHSVKFLGEAGTGKSTALGRVEYLLAQQVLAQQEAPIPIYIELISLTDSDHVLLDAIAGKMELSPELCDDFLSSGEICPLFDGYNEILDLTLQKKVAKELDNLYLNYPKLRFFVSDRAVAKRVGIPTLRQSTELYLTPMNLSDKENYFRKNCRDPKALELILGKMETQPAYFDHLSSPIKLRHLLELVTQDHALPADTVREYIQYLLDRESYEKKDENIEYLPTFLEALALAMPEGGDMPLFKVMRQFSLCKDALGFSTPDTRTCLNLAVNMGLLAQEEDQRIRFSSQDYHDYFFTEAMVHELDTLLPQEAVL